MSYSDPITGESHQKIAQEYLTNDKIEWKSIHLCFFHFIRLWESAELSMKNLLFEVLDEWHLALLVNVPTLKTVSISIQ